jgi:outer membrane protein assembly factor BamB
MTFTKLVGQAKRTDDWSLALSQRSLRPLLVLATLTASIGLGLALAKTPVFGAGPAKTSKRVLFSKCARDRRRGARMPPGGNWPMYSHDQSNSRDQGSEHLIGAGNVSKLGPVWTFSTQAAGAHGDFVGTPVVAGGCVYAGTAGGFIFAINADNGKLVWRQKVTGDINNSLAVYRGVVYAGVTDTTFQPCGGPGCDGPYVVAFNATTGKRLWRTLPVDTQPGSDIYSSPVIYDPGSSGRGQRLRAVRVYVGRRRVRTLRGKRIHKPLVLHRPYGRFAIRLVAITDKGRKLRKRIRYGGCKSPPLLIEGVSAWAAEGEHSLAQEGPRASYEGSVIILNALTGKLVKKVYTIHPPPDGGCPASTCPKGVNDLYAGAGVWSSAAIDPTAKVAYVATANPYEPERESDHANAILKIGIDQRNKATFGKIIASAKGTPDTYSPALQHAPCVNPPSVLDACFDQDLDFGSSPNLYTDARGRKVVGDGQKSGVYWAFDRGSMSPLWSTVVGPPSLVGGVVGTSAYDGRNIYGSITENGGLWSLNATTGGSRWAPNQSLQDGEHYGTPMSFANGVAYTIRPLAAS